MGYFYAERGIKMKLKEMDKIQDQEVGFARLYTSMFSSTF